MVSIITFHETPYTLSLSLAAAHTQKYTNPFPDDMFRGTTFHICNEQQQNLPPITSRYQKDVKNVVPANNLYHKYS